MMFDIMYHPLVGADTDGMEKMPTFCCPNEEMVKRGHKLYLEEYNGLKYFDKTF